jgi:hypothetical protein
MAHLSTKVAIFPTHSSHLTMALSIPSAVRKLHCPHILQSFLMRSVSYANISWLQGINQQDHKTPLKNVGYKGDLIVPGDEDYEVSLNRFANNARRRAGLVAFVKSAEDVSLVIKYATSQQLPLVVRGGGHSTGGSSSTEGGIVIDLSRYVKHVRVDAEKRLTYVGGGADWAAVDPETMKHGLATVGGTVNHTGVGG